MALVLRTISGLLLLMSCAAYTSEQEVRRELARKREGEQEIRDAERTRASKQLMKEVTAHALQELIEKAEIDLKALGSGPTKQQARTEQAAVIARMRDSLKENEEMDRGY